MLRLLVVAIVTLAVSLPAAQETDVVGEPLRMWRPGTLDIHQIVTGRGNAAFAQMPDGTTLLIDAGDAGDGIPHSDPWPNGSQRPGQWIADYIERAIPRSHSARLNHAVVTHFHADHIGALADVAARVPIWTLIDRGWPSYDYPEPLPATLIAGHRAFIAAAQAVQRIGMKVQRARAGSDDQIKVVPYHSVTSPDGDASVILPARARTTIRVVAANGDVWTGAGSSTEHRFPPQSPQTRAEDRPSENECSVALRISYGPFDFYTGGDLTGIPDPGQATWRDLETPIARAIGQTDVRVMHHHGSISPDNAAFLAATQSRVVIIPAWSATHPAPDALKRALAPTAYAGPRDVFVTLLREPTAIAIGNRVEQLKSTRGHIVVRVGYDGISYHVAVVDDSARVLSVHGPYESMQ